MFRFDSPPDSGRDRPLVRLLAALTSPHPPNTYLRATLGPRAATWVAPNSGEHSFTQYRPESADVADLAGTDSRDVGNETGTTADVEPGHGPDGEAGNATVTFEGSNLSIAADDRPLLALAREAGLYPKSGCTRGRCHMCVRTVTGRVLETDTNTVRDLDSATQRLCISVPLGDVAVDL
jgi:hypothetical protein